MNKFLFPFSKLFAFIEASKQNGTSHTTIQS